MRIATVRIRPDTLHKKKRCSGTREEWPPPWTCIDAVFSTNNGRPMDLGDETE